ncbi:MAG: secondary thiamine-phosphate synthase enzyme YjbQ [candidate division Zixibacteria bacterium]|nr:secondary thiamine-phosphate synthase enzyme YjbQ [candidate division Zixibacteria bacterium]
MVETQSYRFQTKGDGEMVDLTPEMKMAISRSSISSGIVTAFVPGSTGGITTVEYEPGLLKDVPELMEKLVPRDQTYAHDETWHDGNGFSHLRAALIGPDITVPFTNNRMMLGTWQQVVFLDFDNRPREREVIFQIMGE